MAKFNVTVNIDYLDEDGNLDDSICEQIVGAVVSNVSDRVIEKVEKKAEEAFNGQISALEKTISKKLNAIMEDFFNTPKDITDQWGDVVEKGVTIKEKLKKACDQFMSQPIDKNGNPTNSSYAIAYKTRVDYLVAKAVDHDMDFAIQKAVKEVTDNLKNKISDEIKKQMGEKLADVVGLKNMLK